MRTMIGVGPRDEAEAVQIALQGGAFARMRMALRAGLSLALNPNDTQQVFYLAFALDREDDPAPRRAARRGSERARAHPSRAAIDSKHVDYAALRALPADTLGGAYARALEAQGLDPDIFQRPPGLPEDLAYVGQRARQTHDLWHVLTGLGTDIPGELALQAFTEAQNGMEFSRLIVRFGLLIFGLRYPRAWGLVRRGRESGRNATFLLAVRWEDLWEVPLDEVRKRVGIVPVADSTDQDVRCSCELSELLGCQRAIDHERQGAEAQQGQSQDIAEAQLQLGRASDLSIQLSIQRGEPAFPRGEKQRERHADGDQAAAEHVQPDETDLQTTRLEQHPNRGSEREHEDVDRDRDGRPDLNCQAAETMGLQGFESAALLVSIHQTLAQRIQQALFGQTEHRARRRRRQLHADRHRSPRASTQPRSVLQPGHARGHRSHLVVGHAVLGRAERRL